MNSVNLVGRLTKDVDLRKTPSGKSVGNFTLAVNRRFKNQQGEYEADFIMCQIWGDSADVLARYVHNGQMVAIAGRINTRNYENQQGQRVYVTEIVVENFTLISGGAQKQEQTPVQQDSPFNDFGAQVDISEDDLPF
mgnify:FL=1